MGQYYRPTIHTENGVLSFHAHDFDNGLKLMEHSWIGQSLGRWAVHRLEVVPDEPPVGYKEIPYAVFWEV